jgi:Uma2 family endonuclease
MATAQTPKRPKEVEYPTSDGKPMAETEHHRDLMIDSIRTLQLYPPIARRFYISGNLLMYYEEGNKRKHVSPDIFAVEGLSSEHRRLYYLTWVEGKNPDVVIELTSKSTKREDQTKKFELYRDRLKVKEYILFDPYGDYLKPRLKGFRLSCSEYEPIEPRADGSIFSEVLGLFLEVRGDMLRFSDPSTGELLPTSEEVRVQADIQNHAVAQARLLAETELKAAQTERDAARAERDAAQAERNLEQEARLRAEAERDAREQGRLRAEAEREIQEQRRLRAELEAEALRREVESLQRRLGGESN